MSDQNRKLVVCCDGTWNEPYQAGTPTNVVKMVRAIRPADDIGVAQMVYYHPGVGTGNAVDRFMGGTLGIGLSTNVQSAYDFLATNYVDGDQIYLLGFSRGAFTARSTAGLIGLVGLLEKRDMDLFSRVYDIYRSRQHRESLRNGSEAAIESAVRTLFPQEQFVGEHKRIVEALLNARPSEIFFIGVWDTVGALGIPLGPLRWVGQSKYNFHDTELSDRVRFAYHALAIDERRENFAPTLWNRPKGRGTDSKRKQTLEQVWFAGAHSNIGGGYPDCGLSDIAFLWMAAKMSAASYASGRPIALDNEYLKNKIDKAMGMLVDSKKGVFKLLPSYQRPILACPPPDKETCEFIHRSVLYRYQCKEDGLFLPYPYRPASLNAILADGGKGVTADLMEIERSYRAWPDLADGSAT
jgi:uncharacterized protein (DUF2235 family)